MSSATDALRRQRRLRVIEIAILILGVADLALTAGSFMMILSVAVIALMAYSLRVNVRTVRLIQRTHRPWPDYSAIAAMEREIYGEEFRHEGAPEIARPMLSPWQREWCKLGHPSADLYPAQRSEHCDKCDERRSNIRWSDRS